MHPLRLETLAISSRQRNSSACKEACQKSRLISLHIRTTGFLQLLFKCILATAWFLDFTRSRGMLPLRRRQDKDDDENRISLLLIRSNAHAWNFDILRLPPYTFARVTYSYIIIIMRQSLHKHNICLYSWEMFINQHFFVTFILYIYIYNTNTCNFLKLE